MCRKGSTMSECNPHGPYDKSVRIAAQPGTPEYQRQFEHQALTAADLTLRMGIVRIACGLLGFLFLGATIAGITDAVDDWKQSWYPVYCALAAVELLSVAIRGKSVYLRFLLSGVRRDK
jgi:hypothetical protein